MNGGDAREPDGYGPELRAKIVAEASKHRLSGLRDVGLWLRQVLHEAGVDTVPVAIEALAEGKPLSPDEAELVPSGLRFVASVELWARRGESLAFQGVPSRHLQN